MKVKFWVYIENLYDGSATARFFKTRAAAEKRASNDDERYCDDIFEKTITIDDDSGHLISED